MTDPADNQTVEALFKALARLPLHAVVTIEVPVPGTDRPRLYTIAADSAEVTRHDDPSPPDPTGPHATVTFQAPPWQGSLYQLTSDSPARTLTASAGMLLTSAFDGSLSNPAAPHTTSSKERDQAHARHLRGPSPRLDLLPLWNHVPQVRRRQAPLRAGPAYQLKMGALMDLRAAEQRVAQLQTAVDSIADIASDLAYTPPRLTVRDPEDAPRTEHSMTDAQMGLIRWLYHDLGARASTDLAFQSLLQKDADRQPNHPQDWHEFNLCLQLIDMVPGALESIPDLAAPTGAPSSSTGTHSGTC